jgi:hypothetical protein
MNAFYSGIGAGLILAISGFILWWSKQQKIRNQKARQFDIEIYEKEVHAKVGSMDPDSLIDDVNKWAGKKPDDK